MRRTQNILSAKYNYTTKCKLGKDFQSRTTWREKKKQSTQNVLWAIQLNTLEFKNTRQVIGKKQQQKQFLIV